MTLHICKSILSRTLKNPPDFHKPHDSFRLFVLFYSSCGENATESKNAVFNLLCKYQISSEIATQVSSKSSLLKDVKNCDSILLFLKDCGFSKSHLEKIVKSKHTVLACKLDRTVKPKIKIFQDLGFSAPDIAHIVSADPWILCRSGDNRLKPSILVLRNLLGSISEVAKALKVSGAFLKCDLEKTMVSNIEILNGCGISTQRIVRQMFSFPRFILHRPESMKKFVEKVDRMGCSRNSKVFIHALRTISSMNVKNWELKWGLFRSFGFSEEEILSMFQRKPQVFAMSNRKIIRVIQVLVGTRKYDISYVLYQPGVLIFSVEKRLKPRLNVVEILEKRNLLEKRPSLSTIFSLSNERFFAKYVLPYLDKVGEINSEGAWSKEIHKFVA